MTKKTGFFWSLYCLSFFLLVIILPVLFSFGHYIACPFFFWSFYCLSFFLLVFLLPGLFSFGFYIASPFSFGLYSACPFSFGHYIAVLYLLVIILPVLLSFDQRIKGQAI
jgi:hypothetical protein